MWNWPFHDPSPIPIAQMLLAANVEVFAIGVRHSITRDTLQKVVKDPAKQAFILGDFLELEKLSLYLSGGGKWTKYFNHIQTWCLLRSRKSFKLNNFKIVKAMTFPKCCQVKFNLLVLTCPSTLTLPWQPSFDNHICLFYVKTSITNSPYSYPSLIFLWISYILVKTSILKKPKTLFHICHSIHWNWANFLNPSGPNPIVRWRNTQGQFAFLFYPFRTLTRFFFGFLLFYIIPVACKFFKIFRRQRNEIPIRPTKFFLLDVMGNAPYLNILYQLSQSMQDMPHKTSLILTISLSHHYVFLQWHIKIHQWPDSAVGHSLVEESSDHTTSGCLRISLLY